MQNRYNKNNVYLSEKEQEQIKNCPIIIVGAGIGSVIAECALRFGFENITIVDTEKVKLSNLSHQNYTEDDINTNAVEAIKKRLIAINKDAKIKVYDNPLTEDITVSLIKDHKIAINALDFTSEIPLEFDRTCQQKSIPVLHPYNLGWGGLVTIIAPDGLALDLLEKPEEMLNEIQIAEYVSSYLKFWRTPHIWIDEVLEKYKDKEDTFPPAQLSIASWTVASMCTHLLFNIVTNKEFKKFPEFYLSTVMNG